jgi:intracellular sulfur oxidation DsrE/DsrF family protein
LFLAVIVSAAFSPPARAQALGPSAPGPVIREFGPVFNIEAPEFVTPRGEYKVAFEVAQGADSPEQQNRQIESLARFLNMHARAGVPREHLRLALVVHGTAGKDLLDHAGYRRRFGVDNPNYDMIQALGEFGVQVILCGQTQMSRGLARDQLAPGVQVALSAMTALVSLQGQGYTLITF